MQTSHLVGGNLILALQNPEVEGASGGSEKSKRIVVSTPNAVGLYYLVGFLSRKTQIQIMARGISFVHHRPFVKTKTIEMRGISYGRR